MSKPPEGYSPVPALLRPAAGICGALLLVFCTFAVIRHWRGESLLEKGKGMAGSQERTAEELLLKSLDHGNAEAAVELAKGAYGRRDWEALRGYTDEALRINPYQGYAHTLRAYAMAAEKMPVDASAAEMILEECRRAVAIEPASGGLWRSCAELSLRIYLHLFPDNGTTVDASAYREEALGFYRTALSLDGRNEKQFIAAMAAQGADALFMVQALQDASIPAVRETVGILLDREVWRSVSPAYWKAADGATVPGTFYRAAVEALRSRKRHREVCTALEKYAFTDKEDAYLAYLAALSAEALGADNEMWPEAERYYLLAVRLDGERSDYRRRAAFHLFRKGALDAAEPYLLRITDDEPGDHQARYYLGRIAQARGDDEGALDYFRAALSIQAGNSHYRKLVEQGEGKGK